MHGGHVDLAIVAAKEVSEKGDIVSLTGVENTDIECLGWTVDALSSAGKVIAIGKYFNDDGTSILKRECSRPLTGSRCVDLLITDIVVVNITVDGCVLSEIAPDLCVQEVTSGTEADLKVSPDICQISSCLTKMDKSSKLYERGLDALADIPNGATVMIDGFAGPGGMPHYLLVSLRDHGAKELTIIGNTAGIARVVNFGTPPGKQAIDHTLLIDNGQIAKAVASYPVSPSASRPTAFEVAYRKGEVNLELVPQGTLAERLRAGGAGVKAFYTPTGVGTLIAEGKETRNIDGKEYILEHALRADFCLIRGHKSDTLGNVIYKGTSRNFNPVMAPAALITIVEVDEVVEVGVLGPDEIVTPGIFIDRIVVRPASFSAYE
jgi:3-oxoacid CoA-transferase A subunit